MGAIDLETAGWLCQKAKEKERERIKGRLIAVLNDQDKVRASLSRLDVATIVQCVEEG